MAEWDIYWIVSQGLNLLVFLIFFITLFLIPSKEKIKNHQAGPNLLKPTIPVLLGIIFASTTIIAIASIFLVNQKWIVLATSGVIIFAGVLVAIDFLSTKKLYKEISSQAVHAQTMTGTVHQGHEMAGHVPPAPAPQNPPGSQHGHVPPAPAHQNLPSAGEMMTVECPNCSGHIMIAEGSSQITCPYCGMSGTM